MKLGWKILIGLAVAVLGFSVLYFFTYSQSDLKAMLEEILLNNM